MNVQKQVEMIKHTQQRYARLQAEIQDRVKRITKPAVKHVGDRLKSEFPDATFYFLPSFQCGSLTTKWLPQIFLYRVNELCCSRAGVWYDEDHQDEKHEQPVPTRKLLAVLKLISEELGVKVALVRQEPYCFLEKQNPEPLAVIA